MFSAENVHDLAGARAADERRQRLAALDQQLSRSDKGVVLGCVSNLILILGSDPELHGLLGYNEFTSAAVMHRAAPSPLDEVPALPGPFPRSWGPADVSHVQAYIQRVWTRQAGGQDTEAAMLAVASGRRFHPPRDWLAGLTWDGTRRLEKWLVKAFGAPDDEYHSAVGSKFLIAAVARVRRPGVKFDHMPILEGPQGIGKSRAIRRLAGDEWFTDSLPSALESRDAALGLQGAWFVEFGEIEQIIRTEVEVIKAFLSRSVDRFRAPYGRNFLSYPRQSVLIGTTNDSAYLRDSSGNRRFWPVACQFADADWVSENREQLFAEAAALEGAGTDFWMHEADVSDRAQGHQADRMMEDAWEARIMRAVSHGFPVTIPELLSNALEIPTAQQGKREQMRVSDILRKHGWRRRLVRDGKDVLRKWEGPPQ